MKKLWVWFSVGESGFWVWLFGYALWRNFSNGFEMLMNCGLILRLDSGVLFRFLDSLCLLPLTHSAHFSK